MGVMIQICEEDINELAEGLEDILYDGGRLMGCIGRMREETRERRYSSKRGEQTSNASRRSTYSRRDDDVWRENDDVITEH